MRISVNFVKIHTNFVNFHKILLKFTMDFQLTNFFGEIFMIISLSATLAFLTPKSKNYLLRF
jgi:hypothetical protein